MGSKLKISIYSHEDECIDLLYDSEKEFNGQCGNPILTINANGAKTLSFDLPLKHFDTKAGKIIDNVRWQYITNQYKIRVEQENENTEEFVLRDYSETHSESDQLMININCMSLAEFELGQTGYNLSFDENSLYIYPENVDPSDPDSKPIGVADADIHFWAAKIIENTDWNYEVRSYYDIDTDMEEDNRQVEPENSNNHIGRNQFYEKDRIVDYTDDNKPIKKDTYDIKERIIKEEKSNRWNLTQTLCESFEVWASYDITYENGKIVKKTIVFRNDIPEDALFSVKYEKNLKSITRQVDDSQLVTKMYVTPLTNPNTDTGVVAIAENEKNFLKENYILDFSWYLGEDREDTDLENKQLINPGLEMDFESTQYAIPAIEEHTTTGTKELIEDYKSNLRQRNKFINSTSQNLNRAKQELADLKSQYEFYLSSRDSALEEVNKIIDEVALIPKGAQYKENRITYIYEEKGYTIIRFSEVGVKSLPNPKLFKSPNNVVDLSGTAYTDSTIGNLKLAVHKTEPITGTIIEARLLNGKIGDAQNYAAFRLNLEYYPLEFNMRLKKYWQAKITEANIQLGILGRGRDNGDTTGLIYEKEIEIDTLKMNLLLAQLEKKEVTNEFEQLLAPFVREGYWEDNSYTTYMNKAETINTANPTEKVTETLLPSQQWTTDYWCYKIPNKLLGQVAVNGVQKDVYLYDIIDIQSIEVMNNDIVNSEYDENFKMYVKGINNKSTGTDYTVEYGYTNTDGNSLSNRGIYINFYEPEDLTIFTQNSSTRMYVRAKARGTNFYIFSDYIGNETYNLNGEIKRKYYSPLTQELILDHEDIILSSVVVTAQTAGLNYLDDGSSQLVSSEYTLIYGTDYCTYKETIDNKVYTKIKLQYTTNVPLMSFDKNNRICNYKIDCNYDVTSKYYYNDALDTMAESSIPQVTYTVSVADLSKLESPLADYSNFKPIAGTRVPIYDEELRFYGLVGFINTVSFNLLQPESTEITISNFKDKFEDLFQKITAATIQLQNKGDYYDYATTITDSTGVINKDILADTLMQNNVELTLSKNNDIIWDERGIEITNKEKNENGVYGKMRITSNGIFISDSYDEYGNYKWETAITPSYINANKMTVGKIDTRQIQIWNSSQPRFLWNENGIYAYGEDSNKQTDFNTYVLYNQNGLQFRQKTERTEGTRFYNLIQNPNFSGNYQAQWSTDTNATLDILQVDGYNCLRSTLGVEDTELSIKHINLDLSENHKYYFRATLGLEGASADLHHSLVAGLKDFSKTINYSIDDGMITIAGIVTGANSTNNFEISAHLSEVLSGWSLKLTKPLLIDLTTTLGEETETTIEELDKLPYFIGDYTYNDTFETYRDAVSLTWDGLAIDAQDGALRLTSENGLEVLQPKETSINGVDKQLRIQVGKWDDLTDSGTVTKYGIRGLNEQGDTFFEVSQEGFKVKYGNTNDTIENIIDGTIGYMVTIHSSNGNVFKNRNIDTILSAIVMKGQENITAQLPDENFIWTRVSKDTTGDTSWNTAHNGVGPSIYINQNDVDSQAVFNCSIEI